MGRSGERGLRGDRGAQAEPTLFKQRLNSAAHRAQRTTGDGQCRPTALQRIYFRRFVTFRVST